jgi:Xaa-Pro dipeptidase
MDSENLFDFQALVVPLDGDPRLVIFDFELGRIEASSWLKDAVTFTSLQDPVAVAIDTIRASGLGRRSIGLEQRGIGVSPIACDRIRSALSDAQVSDAFGVVEGVRLVKSPAEISYMRRAAELTDVGVLAGYDAMRVGARDFEVAAAIMQAMYGAGSDTVCWGPIVASGYLAGAAHSSFDGRTLAAADTVFLELTGERRRYTAPLMRTAILGDPSPEQAKVAEVGAATVRTIIAEARPGRPASEVATAALDVVRPILDDVVFHHYFGYPVGLGYPGTWIETLGFFIRVDEPRPLEAGMTFHLPMSFRKYGEWAVNQSHTILVTETGAEALTRTEARLQVMPG